MNGCDMIDVKTFQQAQQIRVDACRASVHVYHKHVSTVVASVLVPQGRGWRENCKSAVNMVVLVVHFWWLGVVLQSAVYWLWLTMV